MAVLIIAVVVARATDGLVTPLLYRVAGDPYPETERQAITQWAGVVGGKLGTCLYVDLAHDVGFVGTETEEPNSTPPKGTDKLKTRTENMRILIPR